jgi:hypothetical protein
VVETHHGTLAQLERDRRFVLEAASEDCEEPAPAPLELAA